MPAMPHKERERERETGGEKEREGERERERETEGVWLSRHDALSLIVDASHS